MLRPALVEAAARVLRELERESTPAGPALVVTLPWADGRLRAQRRRARRRRPHRSCASSTSCPTTACSTRSGCSRPARFPQPVDFRGVRLGLPICEDIWFPRVRRASRARGRRAAARAERSPFEVDKFDQRLELARAARRRNRPAARLRQPGRRPGRARVRRRLVRHQRRRHARARAAVLARSARADAVGARRRRVPLRRADELDASEPRLDAVYNAMVLGLRDYVRKNGFRGVVLGLSGGIDSALTAAVAVDALGAERVRGVRLPSRFTARPAWTMPQESATAARHAARHDADRRRGRRARGHARAGLRRTARATSPKRTCRRASAACC